MFKPSKKQIDSVINGEISSKDLAINILQEIPAIDVAIALVEEYLSKQLEVPTKPVEKIVLTQDQFDKYFRIKQNQEKRGRPKKIKEDI